MEGVPFKIKQLELVFDRTRRPSLSKISENHRVQIFTDKSHIFSQICVTNGRQETARIE